MVNSQLVVGQKVQLSAVRVNARMASGVTFVCTRTKQASGESVEDLRELGPGTPLAK
jgi:hypothetical protein